MKTIICNEQHSVVDLQEHLNKAQPLVIGIEPFSGEMSIKLDVVEGRDFKGLCTQLSEVKILAASPYYVSSLHEVPDCYFLSTSNEYGIITYFCISQHDLTVKLSSNDQGLVVHVNSGSSREVNKVRHVLLCIQGDDIYQTINLTIQLALQLTGGKGKLPEEKLPLPSWLNTLGWESGASFGKEVTHDKVVNAVWGLRHMGFQPGFVIIGEGWQTSNTEKEKEHFSSMVDFDAEITRFPYGLKGLVEELHRAGVRHVGLWHGIMGHRGGIHRRLARKYALSSDSNGRYFLGSDLEKTFQFFYNFYGYLREQGISFVKIGDQNNVKSYCRPGVDTTKIYQNLQFAIQAATSLQFDTPHFNTECLRNENLFYWTTSLFASAGDNLDTQSLVGAKHATRNLLANSLWLQHLMQPDFEAWVTNLPQSSFLGVLHGLSGSINVISDPPGKYNHKLLRKLVLPSGRIFRSDRPLTLCKDSVFVDPLHEPQVYKAFTYKGDNGILGVFNLSQQKRILHGFVSPNDIEGLLGNRFAVFSHYNGFVGLLEHKEEMAITLKPNYSDVFTFSPVKEGIALIGCYLFYLSPGPITEITLEEDSMHIFSLIEAPMIMYCERKVMEIRRNGKVIPWEYDHKKNVLTLDSRSSMVEMAAVYTITFE